MSDTDKTLPAGLRSLGVAVLAAYVAFVVVMMISGWSDYGETTVWARNKDAVEMVAGMSTAIIAALGGFLLQEKAKAEMAGQIRTVGRELLRQSGGDGRGFRDDAAPLSPEVTDILRAYGV